MMRLGFGLVLAACFLLVYSCREYWLGWKAEAEPQIITAQELADNGPGDNYHVQVTDFRFGEQLIYVGEMTDWKEAWIPIIAPGRTLPDIVLKTDDIHSGFELALLAASGQVQGMVVNDIGGLNSDQKNMFKKAYLGFDFDNCCIVEHNRRPAGTLSFLLKFVGSVALAAVGGFVYYASLRKRR